MPKLPMVSEAPPKERVASERRAEIIAMTLAHRGTRNAAGNFNNGFYYLGREVRAYFDENPEAKAAFVAWYEAQP